MRKTLLSLALILTAFSINAQVWTHIAGGISSPTHLFADISFIDADNGVKSGTVLNPPLAPSGITYKSINGGSSWANPAMFTSPIEDITRLSFPSVAAGYAVGGRSVMKTTNGGGAWTTLFTASNGTLKSIYFINETHGWAVGQGINNNTRRFVRTTDGGATWIEEEVYEIGIGSLTDVFFISLTEGWATNGEHVFYTSDGGVNWNQISQITTGSINRFFFTSSTSGYGVGLGGHIVKTTDGGITWTQQTSGVTVILNDIHFISLTTGWICGRSGTILKTTDGGTTWIPQTSPISNHLNAIDFTETGEGYIVANNGSVLKFTPCSPTTNIITTSACESYVLNGQTYNSTNSYTQTLTNNAGCDSIITINLTINQPTTGTDVRSECSPYTWIDGNEYSSDNTTATYTLQSTVSGCDSIVTLNLTILPTLSGTDIRSECAPYTWIDGNEYLSDNITATHTLQSVISGCDSIVTLNLTITTINTNVSLSGETLTASQTGGDYQWINCDSNTPISGETGQTFTATVNGNYAVEITANNCMETSACVTVGSVGIEILKKNDWNIYPNPVNDKLFIASDETLEIKIMDALGNVLISDKLYSNQNRIDVSSFAAGVYFIKEMNSGVTKKFVKK